MHDDIDQSREGSTLNFYLESNRNDARKVQYSELNGSIRAMRNSARFTPSRVELVEIKPVQKFEVRSCQRPEETSIWMIWVQHKRRNYSLGTEREKMRVAATFAECAQTLEQ